MSQLPAEYKQLSSNDLAITNQVRVLLESLGERRGAAELLLSRYDNAVDLAAGEMIDPAGFQPFPVESLPPACADYVRAGSKAAQCDQAFFALHMLPVLAAAIGNTAVIEVKPGWREPSVLWACLLGPSGSMKTQAFSAATQWTWHLEREANNAARDALEDWRQACELAREEKEVPPERPIARQYVITDTTIESIMIAHHENQRGLAVFRDELGGWFNKFNRYAKSGSELQDWIELYNGGSIKRLRYSDTEPIRILHRAHVCITGTSQPEIFAAAMTGDHVASGFLARFILARPPVSDAPWTEAHVTREVVQQYKDLVLRLYEQPLGEGPLVVKMDRAAKAQYIAFYNENAGILRLLGDSPLRSHFSKSNGLLARLALILQMAYYHGELRSGEVPDVTGDVMRRAVNIVRWVRYETARIYEQMGVCNIDGSKPLAKEVSQLLNALPTRFSRKAFEEQSKRTCGWSRSTAGRRLIELVENLKAIERDEYGKYRKTQDGRAATLYQLIKPRYTN